MLTLATLVRVHIHIAMARDIAVTFEGNLSSLCNWEKQYIRFLKNPTVIYYSFKIKCNISL